MLTLLLTALMGAAATEAPSPYRLPAGVVPDHYVLSLDLDVEGGVLAGEESISLRFAKPTRSFRLHVVGLEIDSPRLRVGERELALEAAFDVEHEMVELTAGEEIPAGAATLEIGFHGALAEGLRGIYLSRAAGRTWIGSQMQATYARQAFPCFDEPAMKATFDLSVVVDAGRTAISNGALLREEPAGEGRKRVVFATSPRMSTYLVALAAGDFACLESEVDGVPVRVCTAPEKREQVRWALEVATRVLGYFNRWYGIAYPFGKLDMVAVPAYEWGGMENTGAIFYRESSLLLDPATASPEKRRRIARLIAHEIAHQWFGDLVTTAWWDDIWLNEGFASWITDKPVAALWPEWDRPESAVAAAQQVIGLDALAATRAIHGAAATPGEIKELFDGIAYTKGAAVLRMVEAYVGEEPFRRGVNAYLERHAHGNARSPDLWRAVAEASGRPVDEILPTFVEQPGLPVLTFVPAAVAGGTRIEVSQQRFRLTGEVEPAGEIWRLPVCFRWADGSGELSERCELLTAARDAWTVPGEVVWLLGNAGGRGYYRVDYSPAQLAAVAGASGSLSAAERLVLLNDAWAATQVGRGGVDDYLRLVERLDGESNRTVIEFVADSLGEIRRTLVAEGGSKTFDAWTRSRFGRLASALGPEPRADEDDETRTLRATLFSILAAAGDPEAISRAAERVRAYLEDPTAVDPSLAAVAFRAAPRHGDGKLFDALLAALAATGSNDARGHCREALTRFEDPALVRRALAFVEEGRLEIDQYPGFFASLIDNRAAQREAWRHLSSHWGDLAAKVTSFGGGGAVRALGAVCSAELEAEVRAFFAENEAPGAERALAQAYERMRQCRRFRDRQGERFDAWLAAAPPVGAGG